MWSEKMFDKVKSIFKSNVVITDQNIFRLLYLGEYLGRRIKREKLKQFLNQ